MWTFTQREHQTWPEAECCRESGKSLPEAEHRVGPDAGHEAGCWHRSGAGYLLGPRLTQCAYMGCTRGLGLGRCPGLMGLGWGSGVVTDTLVLMGAQLRTENDWLVWAESPDPGPG